MKIYTIAITVLMFNLSLGIALGLTNHDGTRTFYGVYAYDYMHAAEGGKDQEFTRENLNATLENLKPKSTQSGVMGINFIATGFSTVEMIFNSLGVLFNTIFFYTLGFPTMLASEPFNVPALITAPLGVLFALIYIVGLVQFVRGVTVE
jgi:hypothetical protein